MLNKVADSNNTDQTALLELIDKIAAGDQKAFRRFYDQTSGLAYAIAMKMVGAPAQAQDVVQEAFLKVWSNADQYYADKGTVTAWLVGIVRYRALDWLRANQRRDEAMAKHQLEANLGDYVVNGNDAGGIKTCISKLAQSQREGIIQTFVFGWTYEEFAERVAKPIGTVKSRIRRGLASLKECLER